MQGHAKRLRRRGAHSSRRASECNAPVLQLLETRKLRLEQTGESDFPQQQMKLLLAFFALADIVKDACEVAFAIHAPFGDSEIGGKGGAIFAAAENLAPDADDLSLAREQVIREDSRRPLASAARA